MSKVKLLNADFRGSTVEGLHLNAEDVRGAVVDPSQAMIFASLLGIRIEYGRLQSAGDFSPALAGQRVLSSAPALV